MSNIILMQTESNEMIGFILLATEESPFSSEDWNGDCIFTGVPNNPDVLSNELCNYLQRNKNIEHQISIHPTYSGYKININGLLSASLNSDLAGKWWPINSNKTGVCFVPSTST